jgi:hypothetical protein
VIGLTINGPCLASADTCANSSMTMRNWVKSCVTMAPLVNWVLAGV